MSDLSLIEQSLLIRTRPVFDLDNEQFFHFCQINRDLRFERTADGDIAILALEGGRSARGSSRLTALFDQWAECDGTGQVFGSSTGFILPNGAIRSPDAAWVRNERLDALTEEEWSRFLPLCPDFVVELRSPSDALRSLQRKMAEYRDNGAQLGWLLDPSTRQVHVYRPGSEVEILSDPDSVSGEPTLRGFVLDVRQIWAVMEKRRR